MKDIPILFSAPMVRGLLREIEQPGTGKTHTRRIMRRQPEPFMIHDRLCDVKLVHVEGERLPRVALGNVITTQEVRFAVGARLWVREAWRGDSQLDAIKPSDFSRGEPIRYEADGVVLTTGCSMINAGKIRPGMFMPRWASRLTLTVTNVKIERLQDISEEDALAEGIIWQNVITGCHGSTGVHIEETADRYWHGGEPDDFEGHESAVDAFADLWCGLNGPDAWYANPWVVAPTFTVHRANIDAMQEAA